MLTLDGLEPVEYSVTVTASINGRISAPSAPETVSGREPLAITGVDADWVDDDQCEIEHNRPFCRKISSVFVNAPDGTNVTVEITVNGEQAISVSGEVTNGALSLEENTIFPTWRTWNTTIITVTNTDNAETTIANLSDVARWWDWSKIS